MTNPNHPWFKFRRTLDDAYKPRPPIRYVVNGLFAIPSLNIVYGPPGCLKSFLLSDLAICVTDGRDWLESAPWEPKKIASRPVIQARVCWIDFDNGVNRTDNRFEALGKAYNMPGGLSPDYYSMPEPVLNASNMADINWLKDLIKGSFELVIIDNLAMISGGKDENSSEMMTVMGNLRSVAENTGAAIVLIHHSRKESGFKGKLGDNLRGFSGIRGAIDTGLYVEREPNSNIVTIRSEKTRDVDIEPFGAIFDYTHKFGCNDLEVARFYGIPVASNNTEQEIQETVIDVLKRIQPNGVLSQTKLIAEVKKDVTAGEKRIETIIKQMAHNGQIKSRPGPRSATEYFI